MWGTRGGVKFRRITVARTADHQAVAHAFAGPAVARVNVHGVSHVDHYARAIEGLRNDEDCCPSPPTKTVRMRTVTRPNLPDSSDESEGGVMEAFRERRARNEAKHGTTKTFDLSAVKPTDQPSDLSAVKPTDQPSDLSADKPTDQPSALSAQQATSQSMTFVEGLTVGAAVVGLDEGLAVGESVVGLDEGLAVGESVVGFDVGEEEEDDEDEGE